MNDLYFVSINGVKFRISEALHRIENERGEITYLVGIPFQEFWTGLRFGKQKIPLKIDEITNESLRSYDPFDQLGMIQGELKDLMKMIDKDFYTKKGIRERISMVQNDISK